MYGSVSYGLADDLSNANIEVIYPDGEIEDTGTYFTELEGKEIKVDFSSWSKYEKYLNESPKSTINTFWVIQKAVILHDPDDRFSKIQQQVNQYLPDYIWKEVVFSKWFGVAFNGVKKAMRRNDTITAQILKGKMVQSILELTYLLNREYLPPVKWLHRKFLELPLISKEINPYIVKLLNTADLEDFEVQEKAIIAVFGRHLNEIKLLSREEIEKPWMFV